MILEGIVTSVNEDGSPNIAPMGPDVDRGLTRLTLRPFPTSRTFQNLRRTGEGVLHVTDDVELLAKAAIGQLAPMPRCEPASGIRGWLLPEACRWLTFRVVSLDESSARMKMDCEVLASGDLRPFFGFNRAKHAVVEAAILATRVHLLPPEQIRADFDRLQVLVDKTAGDQEARAFSLLREFVETAVKPALGHVADM